MNTRNPHLARAVKIAGGQTALGRKIGVSQQRLRHWLVGPSAKVPAEFCRKIESAVSRKVTKAQLRPDVFGK